MRWHKTEQAQLILIKRYLNFLINKVMCKKHFSFLRNHQIKEISLQLLIQEFVIRMVMELIKMLFKLRSVLNLVQIKEMIEPVIIQDLFILDMQVKIIATKIIKKLLNFSENQFQLMYNKQSHIITQDLCTKWVMDQTENQTQH